MAKSFSFLAISTVAVLAVVTAVTVVAVSLANSAHRGRLQGSAPPTVLSDWSAVQVKTATGEAALPSLAPVAIIVSSTCPHCHKMLEALAQAQKAGRAGEHLTIVTIQGLAAGDSMLSQTGIHATSAAPGIDVQAWILQTRVNSVPTFLLFDAKGRLQKSALGELDSAEVLAWGARAQGDSPR